MSFFFFIFYHLVAFVFQCSALPATTTPVPFSNSVGGTSRTSLTLLFIRSNTQITPSISTQSVVQDQSHDTITSTTTLYSTITDYVTVEYLSPSSPCDHSYSYRITTRTTTSGTIDFTTTYTYSGTSLGQCQDFFSVDVLVNCAYPVITTTSGLIDFVSYKTGKDGAVTAVVAKGSTASGTYVTSSTLGVVD